MKFLLKQVLISDRHSPYNGLTKDILVTDGIIESIGDSIITNDAESIDLQGCIVSPGWVDIFSHFNDPGLEYKETLETGAKAAVAGGFSTVLVLPNTQPAIANKSTVEYIIQKSKSLPVQILPLGSISKNIEGKELAEMYDMFNSGAIAFTDGWLPVQTPGLLLKALQYIKAIEGVIIQVPIDKSISKFGLINEGLISTQLGLAGIPVIAEELMVARDIELVKYTESKLHITGITTAKSVQLIKKAKEEGVLVSCSVTPYHLYFCDEDLIEYDTNLKTDPPLRTREDMMALRTGIEEGIIDCITSHHQPQNTDNKICEFEYAAPGMIGLETIFAVVNSIFPSLPNEKLTDLLGGNAREIFSLPSNAIVENNSVSLTIFDRKKATTYTASQIKSKSRNSAFINKVFKGKVVGILCKDRLYLNE